MQTRSIFVTVRLLNVYISLCLKEEETFFSTLLTLLVSLFESNLQRWFCDFWSWRRLELWLLCCYSFLCHRFSHIFVHLQRVTITTIFEGFHDQKLTSKKKVDVEPRREYRSVTVDDRVCEAQKNWQLALSWAGKRRQPWQSPPNDPRNENKTVWEKWYLRCAPGKFIKKLSVVNVVANKVMI